LVSLKPNIFLLSISLIFFSSIALSQDNTATVTGVVKDLVTDESIDFVTVYIRSEGLVAETNSKGAYTLVVPADKELTINFTRIGYKEGSRKIGPLAPSSNLGVDVSLVNEESDLEVVVTESRIEDVGMVREDVQEFKILPTASGNFESILPHIALGTSSGTGGELSSQYNVRGGNYDENLVYINDFEIFRPQLIRASQQEGLSFPNIDLIRDLSFSSGGFQAKYGDKMSSVLDIRYKRPEEFKASVEMSFLGASVHFEGSKSIGSNGYKKLRYLVGARYKTSRYLLGSLDVKGEYTPNFSDIQGYLTYDINRDLQLGLIGNYNRSVFDFVPRSRATTLGLINLAVRLTSDFTGAESDEFTNGMAGASLTYIPERDKNPLFLKLLASNYQSVEQENFDIIGTYSLNQIETGLGDDFGKVVGLIGDGTQHQFARNQLFNRISNVQVKGGIELQQEHDVDFKTSSHFLQFSAKYQHEFFDDKLNEWERLDSAGYSLNFNEEQVELFNVLKSENEINNNRFTAYFQDTYSSRVEGEREMKLTLGVRGLYRDLNEKFEISPRAQLLYKPLGWDKEVSFKLAGGVYYQPAIYREMRRFDGSLNRGLRSQRSIHLLGGMTYDILWDKISNKKFKLIAELYYKKLDNLVSYEVDNVRIRYSGENDATGHVAGLDLRINGEFVPGAESWVNLSLLKARESLDGVSHQSYQDSLFVDVNSVPRPTDQLYNLSIFFQDYLPMNENFKMHMNFTIAGGLPFGIRRDVSSLDNNTVFRNTFRYREYQRVDIGFSLLLWNELWKSEKPNHPFSFTNNVWMSLEVFNLLGIANQASNTWIKTVFNQQYAIPNNLTSRRINLRLKVDF